MHSSALLIERCSITSLYSNNGTTNVAAAISRTLVRGTSFSGRRRVECADVVGGVGVERGVGVSAVKETFDYVDFAVGAVAVADCPTVTLLEDTHNESNRGNGARNDKRVVAYKAGHRPQVLLGICAKSPMRRPCRKGFVLSSQMLFLPGQPEADVQGSTVL
jgi:hypothetical protein